MSAIGGSGCVGCGGAVLWALGYEVLNVGVGRWWPGWARSPRLSFGVPRLASPLRSAALVPCSCLASDGLWSWWSLSSWRVRGGVCVACVLHGLWRGVLPILGLFTIFFIDSKVTSA